MLPVIFKIGPVTIHSFGFMLAVGFLLIAWLLSRDFVRRGFTSDAAGAVVLGAMLGGVGGAKLYFLIDHFQETLADPMGAIVSGAGLTYYGGLLGGALGVIIAGRMHKIPIGKLADMGAPMIALGYGVGRIGCLLNGDDYGAPTDVPWGMAFPNGTPPTDIPVHPTQIYESTVSIGIFLFLWSMRKRWEVTRGRIWGTYLVLGGLERFVVEFWRLNEPVLLGLTMAQCISLGLVGLGAVTLIMVEGKRRRKVEPVRG